MDFPHRLLFPQKTIFKKGAWSDFLQEAQEFGPRGLVVHGKSFEKTDARLTLAKESSSVSVDFFCRAGGEPTLAEIESVLHKAKAIKASWIAGVGGGSVMDLAKASAGLFHAANEPEYYQRGGRIEAKGIPFIAIPTVAGSGAEATPNAVIINSEKKSKLSIRDESFCARKVILDVELLSGLSARTLSFAALDCFAQAYESYTSKNATWFTETLSLKAIELIHNNIESAYTAATEENLSALLLASYLGGIALASARLGVIHGIAHSLGALYAKPHGLICSVCLIPSIKLNRKAMGKKYEAICALLDMDFIARTEQLLESFSIISPFLGKPVIDKEKIIKETLESGSTAANPKTITRADVESLLAELF